MARDVFSLKYLTVPYENITIFSHQFNQNIYKNNQYTFLNKKLEW